MECLEYQIKYHKLPNRTEFQPLSFCELVKFYEEERISDEQAHNLINRGLELANPILFYDASREISFDSYSLNFLWVHAEKQKEEGHLFGQNEERLKRNMLSPIQNWQAMQPDAAINFWYDGEMVDDSTIKKTNESLKDHKIDISKVKLRNVRDIKLVKENPRLFDSEIPIYFRVDLAKAVIADEVMRSDLLPYAIVIDNDVVAITRRQLFDHKTLSELDNLGYAFGTTPDAREENSFIILFNNLNLKTLEFHQEWLIEKSMTDAYAKLAKAETSGPQDVYRNYGDFKLRMRDGYRERKNEPWRTEYSIPGKYMIFPKSQFSSMGGYSDDEIEAFRKALVRIEACK